MPELPDVALYTEALTRHIGGHVLRDIRLLSPFVLRSVTPPISALQGRVVRAFSRIGKRIVFEFDDELYAVVHLMIAGRLRWRPGSADPDGAPPSSPGSRRSKGTSASSMPPAKLTLAIFEFDHGRLVFTEAGSRKRASIQIVSGRPALRALDPGGLEPIDSSLEAFRSAFAGQRHTLKRALTDPHLISGIGNAYSDEILHAARLSPLKLTHSLTDDEWSRLHDATRATLLLWIDRLRTDTAGGFPEKVTAFREGMAVHGRFKEPCPVCGAPVQRIVYADNECNYCARCQTGGRLLADRSLSRLLKDAWPRTLDEI
jgi:formamidopyrimidine-DNA glycosylase